MWVCDAGTEPKNVLICLDEIRLFWRTLSHSHRNFFYIMICRFIFPDCFDIEVKNIDRISISGMTKLLLKKLQNFSTPDLYVFFASTRYYELRLACLLFKHSPPQFLH
jgi:hypothetical protein